MLGTLLALITPLDPLHGDGYNFWSGIGSDLGELAIVTGLVAWWRHRNCYVKGCWHKGHADPEHGHPVCEKHQEKLPS